KPADPGPWPPCRCRLHDALVQDARALRSNEDSPQELLGALSHLFAALLSPPARHQRELSHSTPGTNDDLRCGSWAAGPAAPPRHGCSRSPHRVPVVDEVQDDEPDEGADVDEHGPTGEATAGPRTTSARSQQLVPDRRTQSGELHERALQD